MFLEKVHGLCFLKGRGGADFGLPGQILHFFFFFFFGGRFV